MKNTKTLILVLTLLCCPAIARATIVFNDGQVHNIDSTILDDVDVYDSGNPTTLNLLPGGMITGRLSVYHDSIVNVFGGSISHNFYALQNSTVTISGGQISLDLYTQNNATVTISGGSISEHIAVGNDFDDDVLITIYGTDFIITDTGGLPPFLVPVVMRVYHWDEP